MNFFLLAAPLFRREAGRDAICAANHKILSSQTLELVLIYSYVLRVKTKLIAKKTLKKPTSSSISTR